MAVPSNLSSAIRVFVLRYYQAAGCGGAPE
jgi:hypothetical protein